MEMSKPESDNKSPQKATLEDPFPSFGNGSTMRADDILVIKRLTLIKVAR